MKKVKPVTIIALHGWIYSTKKWQPFIKQLKKYNINLKLLNTPGLTAPIKQPMTLDNYVAWLSEKLLLKTSIILLGHSFGGQIATRFTATHPNKVKQLILIDSSGLRDNSFLSTAKRNFFLALTKLGKTITKNPKAKKLVYKLARETDYAQATPIMQQTMTVILKDQVRSDLPKITTPTLIIWGQKDAITPHKFARYFHKHLTNSQLKIIPTAFHAPHFTHPQKTAQIINQFIT